MEYENPNDFDYTCSDCNMTVKVDDKICPHCGAKLEEIVEEENDEMVVLKIYMNEVDAEVALQHLTSNGIEAYTSRDDTGGMDPFLQLTNGIRILIKMEDLERAKKILEAMDS